MTEKDDNQKPMSNELEEECCRICEFCRKNLLKGASFCQKKTPVAIALQSNAGVQIQGTWPPVPEDEWCGEFKRKKLAPPIEINMDPDIFKKGLYSPDDPNGELPKPPPGGSGEQDET